MFRTGPFRTLIAVYAVALLAGFCEYFRCPAGPATEPDIYGDPIYNFPATMQALYPGRPESEYLLGRQLESTAGRNFRRRATDRVPAFTKDSINQLNADLKEAALHYERAIAGGFKSEENLYYNYALTLMRIQETPEKIDRAIARWRRDFPFSERRDLRERRELIEQQLRRLSALSSLLKSSSRPPSAPTSNTMPSGNP